jgi:hypothetical protein
MKPPGRVVQGVYLIVVGVAFGVWGVISLQDPDYWEPVTLLDHASIWTYSLAFVLAGPALIILVRQARAGEGATAVAWIMAAAAVLTGVANAIEDGFDQEAFGVLYLAGVTPFFLGQILLAILLGLGERRAFALVPMFTFLGATAVDRGSFIVIGVTWAVFGILVLSGRTAGRDPSRDDARGPEQGRRPVGSVEGTS